MSKISEVMLRRLISIFGCFDFHAERPCSKMDQIFIHPYFGVQHEFSACTNAIYAYVSRGVVLLFACITTVFRMDAYSQIFVPIIQTIMIYMVYLTLISIREPHDFSMSGEKVTFSIRLRSSAHCVKSTTMLFFVGAVLTLRKLLKSMRRNLHELTLGEGNETIGFRWGRHARSPEAGKVLAGCFNTRRLHYILPAILLLASFPAFAQRGAVQSHSYIGGTKATVSGLNSTNYMNGIIPAATITVYLTGTTTKASIYSDAGGTVLSNPFTSNTASSVDPGGWIFFAATNQGLDVVMSGGNGNPSCNTAPLCYVNPVTLTDIFPTQSFTPQTGVTNAQGTAPIQVNGASGTPVTGNITVSCPTCSTSSGGVPFLTGNAVFSSASIMLADYTDNCAVAGNYQLAITAYSISSNVITLTYTTGNPSGPSIGNHITLSGFGTSTFLNGQQIVLLTASTTSATANLTHANASATENGIGACSGNIPSQVQLEPFFKGGPINVVNSSIGGGATSLTMLNDYPTLVAPNLTATTGKPSWFFMMPSDNDWASSCPSLSNIEGYYSVQMAWAHIDGATVEAISPLPGTFNPTFCNAAYTNYAQLQQWLRGQGNDQLVNAPVNTTASGSGTVITVASATGIQQWQAVTGSGIPAHTYVTLPPSGTNVTISRAAGTLSSTPVTFYTGGYDNYIDLASVITNNFDPLYFGQTGGLLGHPTESATRIAANQINSAMSAQGTGAYADPNGAKSFTGPVSIYNAGGGLFQSNLDPTTFKGINLCSFTNSGTEYFYETQGQDGGGNVCGATAIIDVFNMARTWKARVYNGSYSGIGFNIGTVGSGPIINSCDTSITRDTGTAGQVNFGNCSALGDATGGVSSKWYFGPATHPTGVCSVNGQFEFSNDGQIYWCNSGTWTQFSGGFSNPMTTLGDTIYGGVAGAATRLAGPATAASHQYLFGELGGATTPAWFDLGANIGTYVTGTSPIVVTQNANGAAVSCPTCGTSTSTAVQINGGSTLGTLNITGNTTQACADSSGSGTAQTCNTSTSFTVFTNACVIYTTTTTNSGTGLTVNVNSVGAKSVAIPGASGWTTTLTASIIPANKPLTMCYDGTNWNVQQTGTSASGGSGVTPAPPYWTDGTHFYTDEGMQVTKPPSSPTWLGTNTPSSYTVQTNGNAIVSTAGTSTDYFLSASGSTSITVVARADSLLAANGNALPQWGICLWDSTNSKLYCANIVGASVGTTSAMAVYWTPNNFTYNGSGNPAFGSAGSNIMVARNGWGPYAIVRAIKVSTTINFQLSLDGGASFQTITSQTGVGTISSGQVHMWDAGAVENLNIISMQVQ